ncbi:hypothetical protein NB231_06725 [Nitrococcus mobilis Nb-231]|uniref:Uncharacterized protein n=1 Tax=Nitrococcus mobilis Nb-231 TaxID=314278 RepID=A4BV79_9GAMM|nr:hypothetical protein NB231_06725 [Nitrococcus mobilis Nb-231]
MQNYQALIVDGKQRTTLFNVFLPGLNEKLLNFYVSF